MPYGYGSANRGRGGPRGGPPSRGGGGGGPPSQGGGAPNVPSRSTPTPVTTGGPPSILSRPTPVTTAKGPPSILSRQTPVTTAKGPPSILSRPPPVTTGGPPSILSRGPSPGITHPFLINKRKNTLKKTARTKWDQWLNQLGRGLTQQPRYIPWGLNKYIQGSAPGMAKIWAGTEGAAPSLYTATRTKGLGNLDDLLKSLTGKIPWGKWGPTGSEGVHVATKPGVAAGYASKATDPLRGTKWATKTGELLKGEIPTKFLNQSRNMWGQIQSIIPADLANKALLGKNVDLSTIKNIAKPVSKFMTRAVPVAGGVISAADAAARAKQGDWLGAALSGASAVPGWGLIPLAAQVGTDWLGITGSKRQNQAQGGIADLYRHGGFSG